MLFLVDFQRDDSGDSKAQASGTNNLITLFVLVLYSLYDFIILHCKASHMVVAHVASS